MVVGVVTGCVLVVLYSLIVDVLCVHSAVELGQSHRQDDAGQQKESRAAQTEPERVLQNTDTRG